MINLSKIPFSGASDNFTKGRNGVKVAALVVHVMAGSERGTRLWFNNPASNVSAHFGVSSQGDIEQFVSTDDTAWHAGKWDWNLKTIGIEHEGRPPGWSPSDLQYAASVQLAAALCVKYGIVPSAATIIPHVQINPLHACPSSGYPLAQYIRDVAALVKSPAPAVVTTHVENLEYDLYDGGDKVGTLTVIKGTDKCYLKSLTKKVVWRPSRVTPESYGRSRLFDPATNKQIGTVSLVLSGPRKAYVNDAPNDILPR